MINVRYDFLEMHGGFITDAADGGKIAFIGGIDSSDGCIACIFECLVTDAGIFLA